MSGGFQCEATGGLSMFDKKDEESINQNPFSLHKHLMSSLFNEKTGKPKAIQAVVAKDTQKYL